MGERITQHDSKFAPIKHARAETQGLRVDRLIVPATIIEDTMKATTARAENKAHVWTNPCIRRDTITRARHTINDMHGWGAVHQGPQWLVLSMLELTGVRTRVGMLFDRQMTSTPGRLLSRPSDRPNFHPKCSAALTQ